jgi:hypothetical protein
MFSFSACKNKLFKFDWEVNNKLIFPIFWSYDLRFKILFQQSGPFQQSVWIRFLTTEFFIQFHGFFCASFT